MCRVLTRALPAMIAGCAVAVVGLLVVIRRVEVDGGSMHPTLAAGHRLAVVPLPPVPGRLVVLRDPRDPSRVLVKRCAERLADGRVVVAGDNPPASTDSRHFGPVEAALLLGRPVYRYQPAERAGWLWSA